jgi:chorismate dehydratase
MTPVRIGAVGYLNARPLTWALDRTPDRWRVRYDVPAVCAALLHAGEVDLGLIPSVEYLSAPDYRFVPGIGIGSVGPIASVAIFSKVPVGEIRRLALDTSSRTSVALVKVLCRHHFRIDPVLEPHGPDLRAMVDSCDAGLLIGDPAFDTDATEMGLIKIDLGEAWTAMSGLPFIYAAWTGRPGAVSPDDVAALQEAQEEGVRNVDAIAREYGGEAPAVVARAARYLRDNVRYGLGAAEAEGLQLFLDLAADLGLAPKRRLEFFAP